MTPQGLVRVRQIPLASVSTSQVVASTRWRMNLYRIDGEDQIRCGASSAGNPRASSIGIPITCRKRLAR
jgi:hypothetical protein